MPENFVKSILCGKLITALLISVNVSAQVSNGEGFTPMEGVVIPKSAPPALAPFTKVEMPSSTAEHLHNPAPEYPRKSAAYGEQGQVMVRVFIGADGVPQKVELQTSSGFARLDKAGMDSVMRWRYVPGKRGGVAEAMWFLQPIIFKLIEKEKEN